MLSKEDREVTERGDAALLEKGWQCVAMRPLPGGGRVSGWRPVYDAETAAVIEHYQTNGISAGGKEDRNREIEMIKQRVRSSVAKNGQVKRKAG